MKKVLVAVAMVLGMGSTTVFAQDVQTAQVVATQQAPQDEFVKIEVTELPQTVTDAVAKLGEGTTIKEAFVCTKEDGKVFKLVLTAEDGTETTVLFNEKGEPVKA